MFPPTKDPADKQKADALDRWVQRQKEEAIRNLPTDLEVLPSPLLLEQMEREAVWRRSPPAPLAVHFGPAVKPSPSSRRKNRGAPSCGSAGEEVVSRLEGCGNYARIFVCHSTVSLVRCSELQLGVLRQHLTSWSSV
ncbi:hypothetical protein CRENBAI_021330 [Crenichthys baileyi]|uniref:Uncharacterized protein n=1 Tax=Crenichthys baileyi TaxID=28760 RepID=A0AAV9QYK2_9TELE